MSHQLQRVLKPWLLVAILGLIVCFMLFQYLVKPLKEEVKAKQFDVNRLSTELFSIKNEVQALEQSKDQLPTNFYKIRKRLPEERKLNDLILRFEEIEYVSKVRIESIHFNGYDIDASQAEMEVPQQAQITATAEDLRSAGLLEDGEEQPTSTINLAELPPDLKLLTYELQIAAESEDHVERFLKEIEQLERVMKIDGISYTLPGEDQIDELEGLAIQASVRLTAFYYEGDY